MELFAVSLGASWNRFHITTIPSCCIRKFCLDNNTQLYLMSVPTEGSVLKTKFKRLVRGSSNCGRKLREGSAARKWKFTVSSGLEATGQEVLSNGNRKSKMV
jgi:hypothetical protein